MKGLKRKKGLTLIEIIIAIAILAIVAITFANMFTFGATTIFSMGHRGHSNIEAQAIADRIYEETKSKDLTILPSEINVILDEMAGTGNYKDYTSHPGNFNEAYDNKDVRYYVENKTLLSGNASPLLTLRVYYQNGKQSVTLTTPLAK